MPKVMGAFVAFVVPALPTGALVAVVAALVGLAVPADFEELHPVAAQLTIPPARISTTAREAQFPVFLFAFELRPESCIRFARTRIIDVSSRRCSATKTRQAIRR
jgi:hypothetical protein